MKSKAIQCGSAFLIATVVGLGVVCTSLPTYAASAKNKSVSTGPVVPALFDRAAVEHLVKNIEQGYNAPVLKAGYFATHIQHPFPVTKGLEVLKTALKQERMGTARWFTLQSVTAWGELHSGDDARVEATMRYGVIFDAVAKLTPSQIQKEIHIVKVSQRSLYDFLHAIPSEGESIGGAFVDTGKGKDVLLKAIFAYARLLEQNKPYKATMPWEEGIKRLNAGVESANTMDRILNQTGARSKSPTLYWLASKVYAATSSPRAKQMEERANQIAREIRAS